MTPTNHRGPLSIGLLLDGFELPAWQRRVIELINDLPEAELTLTVRPTTRPSRTGNRLSHLLYRLYSRLDVALFSPANNAFARVDCRELLADTENLEVSPRRTRFSDYIEGPDLEQIAARRLDVLLRFGFRILRGKILRTPRYGVWSYHHDDDRAVRGGPPGFWEVFEQHATTGVVLQVLTETLDGGKILERANSPTLSTSVVRNRNHVYWKATQFVPRQLQRLVQQRGAHTEPQDLPKTKRDKEPPTPYSGRLYRNPTNLEMVRLGLPWLARTVHDGLYRKLTRDQWFLAFAVTRRGLPRLENFKLLMPPKGASWADPFPVAHRSGHNVFFEEIPVGARMGRISAFEMAAEGPQSTTPTKVIEAPHHLSHPHIFRWRNDLFLMAESSAARTLELYRCVEYPGEWAHEQTLFAGERMVDATPHFDGEVWWLFVNQATDEETHTHDDLYLYSSDRPDRGWTAHPLNPVVADGRSARPAGKLFEHAGALFRPSQDCTPRYGHSIVFNRIERLNSREYRETSTTRIEPCWRPDLLATHTFNRNEHYAWIDGMRRTR